MGLGQTGLLEPAPTLNHALFACLPWSGIAHKREKETRVGEKSKTKAASQLWLHRGSSLLPPLAGRCGRGIGFLRFRTLSWLQTLL